MKNLKKIIGVVLIGCLAFSASACSMLTKTQSAIDKEVVATYGKNKITRGELYKNYQMAGLVSQAKQQYGENYTKDSTAMASFKQQEQQILSQVIAENIILDKAKELKVMPDAATLKSEADKQKDTIKKNNAITDATTMKAFLKQAGLANEAALDDELKKSVIIQKVIDNQTKDVTVTDADIQTAYDQVKYSKYVVNTKNPGTTPKIHALNILASTEADATAIKKRLDNGEDFAAIAKTVNTDATKDNGGDLGDVEITTLVPEFVAGAVALKPGEISGPVKSQYGYHIIKLISKDDFTLKPLDQVKDEVKQTALQTNQNTKFQTIIQNWEKTLKVETAKYEKNL